jgi:glucan phosphorylase
VSVHSPVVQTIAGTTNPSCAAGCVQVLFVGQDTVPHNTRTVTFCNAILTNPGLARVITEAIGERWVTDLDELEKLRPLADDAAFRDRFLEVKRAAKLRFVDWVKTSCGQTVDPDTIFDCQIKRIHEYKRQLLNALRIIVLYNRLRENPRLDVMPRTFFFAGKAAPAYRLAKLIIKFSTTSRAQSTAIQSHGAG